MDIHKHHKEVLSGIHAQLKDVFDRSSQGMYLFLDDEHILCNDVFSAMLKFKSPNEWQSAEKPFLEAYVEGKSQAKLVAAYRAAMEKGTASKLPVTWVSKDGKHVKTEVIIAPIAYEGHLIAIHWIEKV